MIKVKMQNKYSRGGFISSGVISEVSGEYGDNYGSITVGQIEAP